MPDGLISCLGQTYLVNLEVVSDDDDDDDDDDDYDDDDGNTEIVRLIKKIKIFTNENTGYAWFMVATFDQPNPWMILMRAGLRSLSGELVLRNFLNRVLSDNAADTEPGEI